MGSRPLESVLQHIRQIIGGKTADELSDRELLARFLQQHDEEAFSAIVRRHGPMVYGVCRRVLRDAHEAEDVFQATFMVLARKAASIAKQESLGSWLHGVAYRIAGKARAAGYRRRELERRTMAQYEAEEHEAGDWSSLGDSLDKELQNLPAKYRAPLVLCYLEGKTNEEAAQELGCTTGTVRGRLWRGRDLLRDRLVRRGVGVSSAVLLGALMQETAHAAVPQALLEHATRAAVAYAGGKLTAAAAASPLAKSLADSTLWSMLVGRIVRVAGTAVILMGLAGLGVVLGHPALSDPPELESSIPEPLRDGVVAEPVGAKAVLEESTLQEIDVLDSMRARLPFLAQVLDQVTELGGTLTAQVVIKGSDGQPAQGVEALFRWRDGQEASFSDENGIVTFELSRDRIDQLRLVLPRACSAEVKAGGGRGVNFDFGIIGDKQPTRP